MAILDLTGGILDIRVKAGDDIAFQLPTPSDLTSYGWDGLVRSDRDDPTTELGDMLITLSPSSATCVIPGALLIVGTAYYDVKISSPGSLHITTLLSGKITISP